LISSAPRPGGPTVSSRGALGPRTAAPPLILPLLPPREGAGGGF
jgi:hypothetical protein